MINPWMRFMLAVLVLPFVFLTEYFIVAQWLHVIHVSWWWILYTLAADTGNGLFVRWLVKGGSIKEVNN
jgi:hypothetical protein